MTTLRCLLALFAACLLTAAAADTNSSAPEKLESRSLKDCLQPAVKNGGFRMDDQILWCSSVIKVGDTYHMFASRWPAQYGLGGWTKYSECVRATSTNLFGPYTFQEVVLQKRTNNWDNTRIHNVKIVKAGSKFLLYYINTANQTGIATADAVTGPWTRLDKPVMKVSNPAPFVRPDLSIYVFGRLRDSAEVNRGIAFTAPTYQGPYTVLANSDNLLPDGNELEDPTIWWAHNQYNVLLNDWKGKPPAPSKPARNIFRKTAFITNSCPTNPSSPKKLSTTTAPLKLSAAASAPSFTRMKKAKPSPSSPPASSTTTNRASSSNPSTITSRGFNEASASRRQG